MYKKRVYREKMKKEHLVLRNGMRIESLAELARATEQMDGHLFALHVNDHHNDFAHWLRTHHEQHLANEVQHVYNKHECLRLVHRRLWELREQEKEETQEKEKINENVKEVHHGGFLQKRHMASDMLKERFFEFLIGLVVGVGLALFLLK